MIEIKDQLNRIITLENPPKRIISIVPSQTELLFDFGLRDEVVGITKFCIHPNEWFTTKERVGGTKKINIEKIKALQPDLIIANKEENTKEDVEALEKIAPVYISDIYNLEDALEMILQIGSLVNKVEEVNELSKKINVEFEKLNGFSKQLKSCCYLIWYNPLMTIGNKTFINSMLNECGFLNVFENKNRYPQTSIEEIKALNPSIILLSSEPFPFKQKHIDELQSHLPKAKIILVDGEMFSWYGSRLLKAPKYFLKLVEELAEK